MSRIFVFIVVLLLTILVTVSCALEMIPSTTIPPTPTPTASPTPTPTVTPTPSPTPSPTPIPTPSPIPTPTPSPTPSPTPTPTTNFRKISSLPKSGMMFLTFDDGYSNIKIVLDCLRKNNVQCTFFIIGSCLANNPDLWRQAVADGNEICYHTMRHSLVTGMTNQQILDDVKAWNNLAHKILGSDYVIPKLARLPTGNGSNDQRILGVFNDIGYRVIYWNMDTYTGVYQDNPNATSQEIANYIIDRAKVGNISLQHFNKWDPSSIQYYIDNLKERFTLGKLSSAIG